MDFNAVTRQFKEELAGLEDAIRKNYESDIPLIPGISSYLMDAGGKRVRPLLALISAKLCGREIDDAVIKHGCVIEYIHAATLLHDDVVDETTVRRGHETVNSKWGSDASILVGDFLISRAILILAEDCDGKIIRAIAQATKILVEGGILEFTQARKLEVSKKHCLDVIHRKTASIISVSCEMGALLANANEEQVRALVSFGNDFGMAFQLVDDAMDYGGDEELLGKPPGTDFKEGHVTLPLLHLFQNGDDALKKKIESFVQNENITNKEFDYILERMREAKSVEYTLNLAREYLDRAKTTLRNTPFPCPEYIECLVTVADHTVDRYTTAKSCH
ncbi:MAG: octaprenyl diphosphate synthase [Nitrospinaceae bacterium]|nr:MAG: octaprenyl diphosphate synthase [Nitrospinaceae bacterium]